MLRTTGKRSSTLKTDTVIFPMVLYLFCIAFLATYLLMLINRVLPQKSLNLWLLVIMDGIKHICLSVAMIYVLD